MNPLKNNTQRAKAVIIIFWVMLVVNLLTMVSNFMQINLLQSISTGNVDEDAANTNDMRVRILAIATLVVIVCTTVFFILWFRRAYNNLHLTQTENLKYTEGWAAGAWFVPFLNLYRPYEIMVEIWNKTQEATKNLLSSKRSTIVGWWWVLYLVDNIASNVASRVFENEAGAGVETYITNTYAQIVSNVIGIPAIIVAIIMVKQASEMEAKLYDYHENIESMEEDLIGVL